MRIAVFLVALAGCKAVYDAQYDDRATELEAFRTLFQSGDAQVKFMTSSPSKLFWVATDAQTSKTQMHSFEPATQKQVDYSFDVNQSSFEDFHFSDQFIVLCDFDITVIHDANDVTGGTIPNVTAGATQRCAVDAATIYYFGENADSTGQELRSVGPGSTTATSIADFATTFNDDMAVDGMGVAAPGKLLISENGNLWTIDTNTKAAQYLHNPKTGNSGSIAFDDQLVVYPGDTGIVFQRYDEDSSHDMAAAISDGGYSLNFEHSDIQDLDDNDEYTVFDHHLIYRGKSGIFAYGFDTMKTVDLLLDRQKDEFETKPYYRTPTPVGSTLFVQDLDSEGSDHPVYADDLTGRLR